MRDPRLDQHPRGTRGAVRVRTALGAGAAVVLVAALAALAVAALGRGSRPSTTGSGPGAPATATIRADRTRPYLEIAPAVIAPRSTRIGMVLVNPTGADLPLYGADGRISRRSGTGWTAAGSFAQPLTPPSTGGIEARAYQVASPGVDQSAPAVGLSSPAHSTGAPQWVDLPPLAPGSYRLEQGGAVGYLDVRTDANPPLLAPLWARPLDGPPAVRTRTATRVRVTLEPVPARSGGQLPGASPSPAAATPGSTVVEALRATGWVQVATAVVDDHPGPAPAGAASLGAGDAAAFAVALPALDDGVHRLVRRYPTGDVGWSLFWVADDLALPGLHRCTVRDPLANENGAASWAAVARWNGVTYASGGQPANPDQVGQLLGAVTCNVATSGLGAGWLLQDGDATVDAGTPLYALQGTPIRSAVIVGGLVFRA